MLIFGGCRPVPLRAGDRRAETLTRRDTEGGNGKLASVLTSGSLKYVEYLDSSHQVMSRGHRVTQRYLCQVSIAIGIGGNINIISVALSGIKCRSETLVNISSVYTTTTSVPEI